MKIYISIKLFLYSIKFLIFKKKYLSNIDSWQNVHNLNNLRLEEKKYKVKELQKNKIDNINEDVYPLY